MTRYKDNKLHIAFLTGERNEPAKAAGKKTVFNKGKTSKHQSGQTPWTRLQTKR